MFSLCRCLEAVLGMLGSVPRSEPRSIAFAYHAVNTVLALFLICLNSFSVSAIMLYALTMSLDSF